MIHLMHRDSCCRSARDGIASFLQAKENGSFSFPVLFYCVIFAVIMAIGAFVKEPKNK